MDLSNAIYDHQRQPTRTHSISPRRTFEAWQKKTPVQAHAPGTRHPAPGTSVPLLGTPALSPYSPGMHAAYRVTLTRGVMRHHHATKFGATPTPTTPHTACAQSAPTPLRAGMDDDPASNEPFDFIRASSQKFWVKVPAPRHLLLPLACANPRMHVSHTFVVHVRRALIVLTQQGERCLLLWVRFLCCSWIPCVPSAWCRYADIICCHSRTCCCSLCCRHLVVPVACVACVAPDVQAAKFGGVTVQDPPGHRTQEWRQGGRGSH